MQSLSALYSGVCSGVVLLIGCCWKCCEVAGCNTCHCRRTNQGGFDYGSTYLAANVLTCSFAARDAVVSPLDMASCTLWCEVGPSEARTAIHRLRIKISHVLFVPNRFKLSSVMPVGILAPTYGDAVGSLPPCLGPRRSSRCNFFRCDRRLLHVVQLCSKAQNVQTRRDFEHLFNGCVWPPSGCILSQTDQSIVVMWPPLSLALKQARTNRPRVYLGNR
jgi:hypothetical protein